MDTVSVTSEDLILAFWAAGQEKPWKGCERSGIPWRKVINPNSNYPVVLTTQDPNGRSAYALKVRDNIEKHNDTVWAFFYNQDDNAPMWLGHYNKEKGLDLTDRGKKWKVWVSKEQAHWVRRHAADVHPDPQSKIQGIPGMVL